MIEILAYQPNWPARFTTLGRELRRATGANALAIHHIGSTSVPGLAAKDVIDVQITVEDLEHPFRANLEALGLSLTPHTRDHLPQGLTLPEEALEKRLFTSETPRANVHIRVLGRCNQPYALLCRDYLRTHGMAADAYAEIKRQLARYFPNDTDAYYAIKDPVFDIIVAGALEWAERTSWQQPPSDA